ncbi:vWA domain-containing protein [Shimia sp. MIT1388]|uniref:vWA domain-containing protein n=1 Tax=Shimia sp. MIT1388 TaxID=3096992 RepID=UPI003999DD72
MKRVFALTVAATVAMMSGPNALAAQVGSCATDAMLVFDGSTSMAEISFETGPNTRIVEARQAIRRAMPDIAPYRRVGLMTYGPGAGGACANVDLRFGPVENAAGPVIAAIDGLQPDGLTPLTAAVQQAAEAMDYRNSPGVVVLVTDGNETCGGRPCAVARAFRATARDLVVHVIGFRAEVDFFAWNNPEQDPLTDTTVARCLADETGGLFVTTETVDELVAALQRTLGCPVIGAVEQRHSQTALAISFS